MNEARRLVIVSNRLPVRLERGEPGWRLRPSCGGLVSALEPVLRQGGGCWIGWTGTDSSPELRTVLREESQGGYALVPVFLTTEEEESFYRGCCNEILWPLFHDLQSRCRFVPEYWEAYREVNEKFADAVEEAAGRDDFVWVHDYHLMLLGSALRARGLRVRPRYFHHIPFPPPDIFEKLPWRTQILRGLLEFHAVGFQTGRDRRNFIACVRRYLRDAHVQRLGDNLLVRAEGLCCSVGTFPISIDYEGFAAQAAAPAVTAKAEEIQRSLAPSQIIFGLDRLDYTKGIPERLLAFRSLLEHYEELRGLVTMAQVVVPSRENVPEYKELKLTIERLVSAINGEYGSAGWVPVRYFYRSLSRLELAAFYRAADVALITPLKDGMNLVAKEFCASRVNDDGVLVLSEFAGAATELGRGALLVNPNDTEGMAAALYRAVRMSGREQRVRMQRMRRFLRRHDVFGWCESFCGQPAGGVPTRRSLAPPLMARTTEAVA